MPGLHKGVSTQHTNHQALAKPRHQPLERGQKTSARKGQKIMNTKRYERQRSKKNCIRKSPNRSSY